MSPPHSPDEFLNVLDAEARLATLELFEEVATFHEAEPCPMLRKHYADLYRKTVGVDLAERDAFRTGLEHLRETGAVPVARLILGLRDHSPKGLGDAAEPSA